MKTQKIIFFTMLLIICTNFLSAQMGSNIYEKNRISCNLAGVPAADLVAALQKSDDVAFTNLQTLFNTAPTPLTGTAATPDLAALAKEIGATLNDIKDSKRGAVILIYRDYTTTTNANGSVSFSADSSKINFKLFHKRTEETVTNNGITSKQVAFSDYLLATKNIYFVIIDLDDTYYNLNAPSKNNMLSTMTTKINYRKSVLSESAIALGGIIKTMGAIKSGTLKFTLIKMDPARIKDPCDIVASHPKFVSDQTYTIHEMNIATFQVGVTGSKLNLDNVSIANGDLNITPSASQATAWKSNAYALFEVHLPRDVDNFRPILQSIFSSPDKRKSRDPGQWLYDNTISRIGIYAGAKIGSDPLSNLYAGFNYAISKTLALNFGWQWVNDYTTQVTNIGNITSLSDALKYAKRSYGPGKFSLGISFSPSAFATLTAQKAQSSTTQNQ